MEPVYPRIIRAINDVCEYYEIAAIKLHLRKYAGTETSYSVPHLTERYSKYTDQCLLDMEAEIKQIILTTTQDTKVLFFESIKDWLEDWRIITLNKEAILFEIDKYNDKVYNNFLMELPKSIEAFQSTSHYHLNHLEEYEVKVTGWIQKFPNIPITIRKDVNYKYYCIHQKPEYIDTDFIEPYYQLVDKIRKRFKAIIEKYVRMYLEGKIVPIATVGYTKEILINADTPSPLPEPATDKKLRVNLTVKQLAYLFKLLNDINPSIFAIPHKTTLYKFVAEHFITKKSEELSDKNFGNEFTDPEKKTANFWVKHLQQMLNQARKL